MSTFIFHVRDLLLGNTMTARPRLRQWEKGFSATLLPVAIAIAAFFSWMILANGLRIPYWLYYERNVYLIYLGRSLDPIAWVLSSVFTALLVAENKKGRSTRLWRAPLVILVGIALGTLGLAGLGRSEVVAGSLLTLVGVVLGANAVLKELTSTNRGNFLAVMLFALSLLILPAELGSLSYYLLSASHPGIQVGKSWELFERQLWYAAFPLIPFLYVAFLFSWLWMPPVMKGFGNFTQIRHDRRASEIDWIGEGDAWLFLLAAYVILAVIIGYYPYFHDPSYPLVGTDIYWRYALPAERVQLSTSWLTAAAKERHPVVALMIVLVATLLNLGVESLLKFAYVGLFLAFGGAIFLLALAVSRSKMAAAICALTSVVSAPAISAMFTGRIAEWFALVVWILTLALLAVEGIHGARRWVMRIAGLALGSITVLFVHPWTWIAMMLGLVVYSAALVVLLAEPFREVVPISIVIIMNGAVCCLIVLWGSQGGRAVEAMLYLQQSLASKYFGFGSWDILLSFSRVWSQFLHPVLLICSVLGIMVLLSRPRRPGIVLLSWVSAASLASLVAAPMGPNGPLLAASGASELYAAILLTPVQIPTGIALLFLGSLIDLRLKQMQTSPTMRCVARVVLAIPFLAITNGAFRSLFPLLVDPNNYPNPFAP